MGVSESSVAWLFPLEKWFQSFELIYSKTNSGTFSVLAAGDRVSRPRGVALQAAGLERDNRRFRAKAAGLERAVLQAGNFCAKSDVVALQAGGLERDAARPMDSELRHSPVVSLEHPQSNHRPCTPAPYTHLTPPTISSV